MNVKIDTKEKFVVITPLTPRLTANMTDELTDLLLPYMQKDIPHIIFNMSSINETDEKSSEVLTYIQQKFYEDNHSFVICCLQQQVEDKLDELELLELLNVTPTESEAWDIVQLEEIERELSAGDD